MRFSSGISITTSPIQTFMILVINTEQLGIEGATETLISGFHLWLNNRVSKEAFPRSVVMGSRIDA